MTAARIIIETGKKKTFAGAIDWPGWCRSSRNKTAALQTLVDYGLRYARVLQDSGIAFQTPSDVSDLVVVERQEGNATTDFGAPAMIADADREPLERPEFDNLQRILQACWRAFDGAVQGASGSALRRGPRGGGRDLEKILVHIIESDQDNLRRLAFKPKRNQNQNLTDQLDHTWQQILDALTIAMDEGIPERGARGGVIWPPRYFIRRLAWHVLDHAWEIEDRRMDKVAVT